MSDAIDLATKETYQLVSFVHTGGAAYYTDWTSDVSFGGKVYLSTPALEVKLPANDGLFGEKVCNISVPLIIGEAANDLFAGRISNGQPHAPVDVIVREVIASTAPGPSRNVHKPFLGQVELVIRNARGNKNKIKIQCMSPKARLADIALGIPANVACSNNLGDASCQVDLTTNNRTVSVVVASLDSMELTINSNGEVEGKVDRFFHRGFLQFEGLNITIRDWVSAAPLKFQLAEQAPAHWVGETISAVVGCDQSIAVCKAKFAPPGGVPNGTTGNESNFMGLGIAIPPYHPMFEEGP